MSRIWPTELKFYLSKGKTEAKLYSSDPTLPSLFRSTQLQNHTSEINALKDILLKTRNKDSFKHPDKKIKNTSCWKMYHQWVSNLKSWLFSIFIFNCFKIHWTFLASEAHLQTSKKIGIILLNDANQKGP